VHLVLERKKATATATATATAKRKKKQKNTQRKATTSKVHKSAERLLFLVFICTYSSLLVRRKNK